MLELSWKEDPDTIGVRVAQVSSDLVEGKLSLSQHTLMTTEQESPLLLQTLDSENSSEVGSPSQYPLATMTTTVNSPSQYPLSDITVDMTHSCLAWSEHALSPKITEPQSLLLVSNLTSESQTSTETVTGDHLSMPSKHVLNENPTNNSTLSPHALGESLEFGCIAPQLISKEVESGLDNDENLQEESLASNIAAKESVSNPLSSLINQNMQFQPHMTTNRNTCHSTLSEQPLSLEITELESQFLLQTQTSQMSAGTTTTSHLSMLSQHTLDESSVNHSELSQTLASQMSAATTTASHLSMLSQHAIDESSVTHSELSQHTLGESLECAGIAAQLFPKEVESGIRKKGSLQEESLLSKIAVNKTISNLLSSTVDQSMQFQPHMTRISIGDSYLEKRPINSSTPSSSKIHRIQEYSSITTRSERQTTGSSRSDPQPREQRTLPGQESPPVSKPVSLGSSLNGSELKEPMALILKADVKNYMAPDERARLVKSPLPDTNMSREEREEIFSDIYHAPPPREHSKSHSASPKSFTRSEKSSKTDKCSTVSEPEANRQQASYSFSLITPEQSGTKESTGQSLLVQGQPSESLNENPSDGVAQEESSFNPIDQLRTSLNLIDQLTVTNVSISQESYASTTSHHLSEHCSNKSSDKFEKEETLCEQKQLPTTGDEGRGKHHEGNDLIDSVSVGARVLEYERLAIGGFERSSGTEIVPITGSTSFSGHAAAERLSTQVNLNGDLSSLPGLSVIDQLVSSTIPAGTNKHVQPALAHLTRQLSGISDGDQATSIWSQSGVSEDQEESERLSSHSTTSHSSHRTHHSHQSVGTSPDKTSGVDADRSASISQPSSVRSYHEGALQNTLVENETVLPSRAAVALEKQAEEVEEDQQSVCSNLTERVAYLLTKPTHDGLAPVKPQTGDDSRPLSSSSVDTLKDNPLEGIESLPAVTRNLESPQSIFSDTSSTSYHDLPNSIHPSYIATKPKAAVDDDKAMDLDIQKILEKYGEVLLEGGHREELSVGCGSSHRLTPTGSVAESDDAQLTPRVNQLLTTAGDLDKSYLYEDPARSITLALASGSTTRTNTPPPTIMDLSVLTKSSESLHRERYQPSSSRPISHESGHGEDNRCHPRTTGGEDLPPNHVHDFLADAGSDSRGSISDLSALTMSTDNRHQGGYQQSHYHPKSHESGRHEAARCDHRITIAGGDSHTNHAHHLLAEPSCGGSLSSVLDRSALSKNTKRLQMGEYQQSSHLKSHQSRLGEADKCEPRETSSSEDSLTERVRHLLAETAGGGSLSSVSSDSSSHTGSVNYNTIQNDLDEIQRGLTILQQGELPLDPVDIGSVGSSSRRMSDASEGTTSKVTGSEVGTPRKFSWDYGDLNGEEATEYRFVTSRSDLQSHIDRTQMQRGEPEGINAKTQGGVIPKGLPTQREFRDKSSSDSIEEGKYTRIARELEKETSPQRRVSHSKFAEESLMASNKTPASKRYDFIGRSYDSLVRAAIDEEVERITVRRPHSGDDTSSLSQKVNDLMERESPQRQAYKYLAEAEDSMRIMKAKRESHLRASDTELHASLHNASSTSSSFALTPIPKRSFHAFGNLTSFLTTQLDKMSNAAFDTSVELRSPLKRCMDKQIIATGESSTRGSMGFQHSSTSDQLHLLDLHGQDTLLKSSEIRRGAVGCASRQGTDTQGNEQRKDYRPRGKEEFPADTARVELEKWRDEVLEYVPAPRSVTMQDYINGSYRSMLAQRLQEWEMGNKDQEAQLGLTVSDSHSHGDQQQLEHQTKRRPELQMKPMTENQPEFHPKDVTEHRLQLQSEHRSEHRPESRHEHQSEHRAENRPNSYPDSQLDSMSDKVVEDQLTTESDSNRSVDSVISPGSIPGIIQLDHSMDQSGQSAGDHSLSANTSRSNLRTYSRSIPDQSNSRDEEQQWLEHRSGQQTELQRGYKDKYQHEPQSEYKAERRLELQPEYKAEDQSESRPNVRSDQHAENRSDQRADSQPKTQSDSSPDIQPNSSPDSRPDSGLGKVVEDQLTTRSVSNRSVDSVISVGSAPHTSPLEHSSDRSGRSAGGRSSTTSNTNRSNLRPYRPPGSNVLYYVEGVADDGNASVTNSETTIESTHIGSDDFRAPQFPSHFLGSRPDPPQSGTAIHPIAENKSFDDPKQWKVSSSEVATTTEQQSFVGKNRSHHNNSGQHDVSDASTDNSTTSDLGTAPTDQMQSTDGLPHHTHFSKEDLEGGRWKKYSQDQLEARYRYMADHQSDAVRYSSEVPVVPRSERYLQDRVGHYPASADFSPEHLVDHTQTDVSFGTPCWRHIDRSYDSTWPSSQRQYSVGERHARRLQDPCSINDTGQSLPDSFRQYNIMQDSQRDRAASRSREEFNTTEDEITTRLRLYPGEEVHTMDETNFTPLIPDGEEGEEVEVVNARNSIWASPARGTSSRISPGQATSSRISPSRNSPTRGRSFHTSPGTVASSQMSHGRLANLPSPTSIHEVKDQSPQYRHAHHYYSPPAMPTQTPPISNRCRLDSVSPTRRSTRSTSPIQQTSQSPSLKPMSEHTRDAGNVKWLSGQQRTSYYDSPPPMPAQLISNRYHPDSTSTSLKSASSSSPIQTTNQTQSSEPMPEHTTDVYDVEQLPEPGHTKQHSPPQMPAPTPPPSNHYRPDSTSPTHRSARSTSPRSTSPIQQTNQSLSPKRMPGHTRDLVNVERVSDLRPVGPCHGRSEPTPVTHHVRDGAIKESAAKLAHAAQLERERRLVRNLQLESNTTHSTPDVNALWEKFQRRNMDSSSDGEGSRWGIDIDKLSSLIKNPVQHITKEVTSAQRPASAGSREQLRHLAVGDQVSAFQHRDGYYYDDINLQDMADKRSRPSARKSHYEAARSRPVNDHASLSYADGQSITFQTQSTTTSMPEATEKSTPGPIRNGEVTLQSIPEDMTLESISTTDVTSSDSNGTISLLLQQLPDNPKLLKLQMRILRQRQKHEMEKLREKRLRRKIHKLQELEWRVKQVVETNERDMRQQGSGRQHVAGRSYGSSEHTNGRNTSGGSSVTARPVTSSSGKSTSTPSSTKGTSSSEAMSFAVSEITTASPDMYVVEQSEESSSTLVDDVNTRVATTYITTTQDETTPQQSEAEAHSNSVCECCHKKKGKSRSKSPQKSSSRTKSLQKTSRSTSPSKVASRSKSPVKVSSRSKSPPKKTSNSHSLHKHKGPRSPSPSSKKSQRPDESDHHKDEYTLKERHYKNPIYLEFNKPTQESSSKAMGQESNQHDTTGGESRSKKQQHKKRTGEESSKENRPQSQESNKRSNKQHFVSYQNHQHHDRRPDLEMTPEQASSCDDTVRTSPTLRTIGINVPTPISISPPTHRQLRDVTMVSEAVQTSPYPENNPAVVSVCETESEVDNVPAPAPAPISSRHHQLGAFTPESLPASSVENLNQQEKGSTEYTKTKVLAGPAGMAWYIPLKDPRPWRRPLRERQAHAVFMETWPPRGEAWHTGYDMGGTWGRRITSPSNAEIFLSRSGYLHKDDGGALQPKMSLQEAFARRCQDFISVSRERQKHLMLKSEERQIQDLHARQRAQLFRIDRKLDPNKNAHPYSENLFHPKKRVMTKKEMKELTNKKYANLEEVKRHREDAHRVAEYRANRLRAENFKHKVLSKVLHKKGAWVD